MTSRRDDSTAALGRRPCLLAVAAVVTMTAAGACNVFEDECLEGESRCQGDRLEVCYQNDETGTKHFRRSEDCDQIAGHTCRTSNSPTTRQTAACVSDERCQTSTCEGEVAVLCHPSGFVQSRTDCAAQPAKTCAVGGGQAACTYPIACPTTDADSFCDPDGHRLWSGCRGGYGHPTVESDCAAKDLACASGNGATECVLPARIACDTKSQGVFCSPDASAVYYCGRSGFVDESRACATAGTSCTMTVKVTGDATTSSTGCGKP